MSVIHLPKYIANQSSGVYACLVQRSQRGQWAHVAQVLVKRLQLGKDESGKSFHSREGAPFTMGPRRSLWGRTVKTKAHLGLMENNCISFLTLSSRVKLVGEAII